MKLIPFASPIWLFEIQNDLQDEIDLSLKIAKESGSNVISNVGGFQSKPLNLELLFPKLAKEISPFLNQIATETSMSFSLVAAWLNINGFGHYNTYHCHPDCTFSGVVYLSTPEKSGNIIFRNPTPAIHYPIRDDVDMFHGSCIVKPKKGAFVVFPSYLDHCVEPSQSKEPRISIALNFRQR